MTNKNSLFQGQGNGFPDFVVNKEEFKVGGVTFSFDESEKSISRSGAWLS